MDTYTRLQTTAQAFVDSYDKAVMTKDINHVNDALTPDCHRHFVPNTLIKLAPSLAAGRTPSEYIAQETPIFAQWAEGTKSSLKDITVDVTQMKVVAHVLHHCVTHDGNIIDLEFVYMFHMTDDGSKIKKIVQFVDTLPAKQIIDDMGARESVEAAAPKA